MSCLYIYLYVTFEILQTESCLWIVHVLNRSSGLTVAQNIDSQWVVQRFAYHLIHLIRIQIEAPEQYCNAHEHKPPLHLSFNVICFLLS
jgi:hypothetical protein